MSRVLVTGANGFVGQALCHHLLANGFSVRAAFRTEQAFKSSDLAKITSSLFEPVFVGDIDSNPDWSFYLQNIDTIIHLAARVHIMKDLAADPLSAFRKVNVIATKHLATSAAQMGVKRFVFLSSIHVNGLFTAKGKQGFTEEDLPNPQGAYAQSKWEAEQSLQEIEKQTSLKMVILRPSLVYGKGAKGNFETMIRIIKRGIPLPLASIKNSRSFIYVENLCDAISVCASHAEAEGQTYLVSDNEIVSTPELIRFIARAMNKSPKLWPFPAYLIYYLGKIMGQSAIVDRLFGSLVVNNSKIRKMLGWSPKFTLEQGLQQDFVRK